MLILVSQDCDIAHQSYEVEPFIEVLVATRKTATDEDKGLQWEIAYANGVRVRTGISFYIETSASES